MSIYTPTIFIDKMIDITHDRLEKLGVKAMLVDVDNTMTFHGGPTPAPGVAEWIDGMKSLGYKMMIVSNNSEARLAPFAAQVGLDFIEHAGKPRPGGFRRACELMGVSPKETMVVGDQIFTDIEGGNRFGAITALTTPYQPESMIFFKLRRLLERPIRNRLSARMSD